jgi:DNA-binding response OmpR family regulator
MPADGKRHGGPIGPVDDDGSLTSVSGRFGSVGPGTTGPYSRNMAARVLVVEDDATVSQVVSAYLERDGYECRVAVNGLAAEQEWVQWRPDLVVLDVMLPGLSGLEVLRRRRTDGDETPVVMLSARGEEEDRVVGLEFGADDYLVKPFSPRELVLRISGLLRRDQRLRADSLLPRSVSRGDVMIDAPGRMVTQAGVPVDLTKREFDLITFLISYPGQVFTKRELLRRVWGWDFGDTSTVTVHIRRLREKIEKDPSDPRLILTVRGVGYRFTDEQDSHADS